MNPAHHKNRYMIYYICKTLNCGVDDILEFTGEEK